MPFVTLDGIKTHFIQKGAGPHLLMMAPRAFDSTLRSWEHGKWSDMKAIDTLSRHFSVIAYDRREAGQSCGRVETLTWKVFAQHAKLLIEHLAVERTLILGVCMGVAVATQFASLYPDATAGLILAHPVGGYRWKNRMHAFFSRHITYARQHGLDAVRARATDLNFMRDPETGPWATSITNDTGFADRFVRQDIESYLDIVTHSRDAMFPDTFVSGPPPGELMTIDVAASIWPGDDASHSTSSAQQLRELLPRMDYWDLHPDKQTAENMLTRIVDFKETVETQGLPLSPPMPGPPMPPLR
jgi:pimeloyl-ACP methyl ester carboxylesterase